MSDDLNPYASPKGIVAAEDKARPRHPEVEVASKLHPARLVSRWLVGAGTFGCGLGMASRAVRPYFGGPMHWETIVTLAVLIIMSAVFVLWVWREPLMVGLLSYELGALAVWSGHLAGWSVLHGFLWEDILLVSAGWWGALAVLGGLLLAIPHERRVREQ